MRSGPPFIFLAPRRNPFRNGNLPRSAHRHNHELSGPPTLGLYYYYRDEPVRKPAGRGVRRRPLVRRTIRLRGITGPYKGEKWESDSLLRAGRLNSLEVV